VTQKKVHRIRQVASCFLQERGFDDHEVRFLAVSVQYENDGSISCMEFLPFE
jgi:Holliday junction resolvase-like predicted endonuclease